MPNSPHRNRAGAGSTLAVSANKVVRGAMAQTASTPTPALTSPPPSSSSTKTTPATSGSSAAALLGTGTVNAFGTSAVADVAAQTIQVTCDGLMRTINWVGNVSNPTPAVGNIIVSLLRDAVVISGPQIYSGLVSGGNVNFNQQVGDSPSAGVHIYTVQIHVTNGAMTGLLQGMTMTIT